MDHGAEKNQVGRYKLTGILGSGGFGRVYQCLDMQYGHTYALKTIAKEGLEEADLRDLRAEISLLQNLNHPNVVDYIDTIQEDGRLYVVLEYADQGSLAHMLKQFEEGMEENLVIIYLKQVLQGLAYLHSEGVIHRDIKGANLLLNKDSKVKLTDFGVATQRSDPAQDDVVGTPYWMAPEIIEMRQQTPKCDIWSLGCTTLELLTGKPPYFDLDPIPALFRIVQDNHPPLPARLSAKCQDFLLQCFQKESEMRPSAKQLLRHAWLRSQREEGNDGERKNLDGAFGELDEREDEEELEGKEDEDSRSGDSDWDSRSETGSQVDEYSRSDEYSQEVEQYSQEDEYSDYSDSLGARFGEREDDNNQMADLEIDLTNFDFQTSALAAQEDQQEEDDASSETDPFELTDAEEDHAMELSQQKDTEVKQILRGLESSWQSDKIHSAVQRLSKIFSDDPQQIASAMSYHGVIPIMEMLDHEEDDAQITLKVLALVNQIISHENGQTFLESLCVVGLIPAVSKLLKSDEIDIRRDATKLIQRFCRTDESNNFVRKMFVASDGIRILVTMLDADYQSNKKMVLSVLDCIFDIFKNPPTLQEHRREGAGARRAHHPKRDFCRLFTKASLLRRLVVLLRKLMEDEEFEDAELYAVRVGWLLKLISSQNDPVVKRAFTAVNVLRAILRILSLLAESPKHQLLLHLLKVMRALTDPSTIEELIKQKAVSGVCPFLSSREPEIQNQVIMCMFHMVNINKQCREEAALCGIIPVLMKLTQTPHISRSFVVAILCKMPELASDKTLYEMKKHNGIEFFLDLVENTKKAYIQVDALQALSYWLRQDTARVELQLVQPHHVTKLITVFSSPKNPKEFLKVLTSLHDMTRYSQRLDDALGSSEVFLRALDRWLNSPDLHSSDTFTLLTLLTFTSNLFDQMSDTKLVRFVQILYKTIEKIELTSDRILVKEQAGKILSIFQSSVDIAKLGLHE